MNKTKIEWTNYTWNPIVGCLHNCWYCYGKRIAKRFFKDNPNYKPKLYLERLKEPYKVKKPSKIFVCSMADLFGDWVKKSWINDVLLVAERNPQHIFQFLTKNPKRYLEFDFPKNCWLGTTMTEPRIDNLEYLLQKDNYKFVSCEPLLADMSSMKFDNVDLVIVGAMTGMGKKNVVPKKEWIESIHHNNIFYKNNIKKYL